MKRKAYFQGQFDAAVNMDFILTSSVLDFDLVPFFKASFKRLDSLIPCTLICGLPKP